MAQILNNLGKGMIRNTNNVKKDPQFYNFALNISTDKNQLDRLTRVTEHKLEDYYSLKNEEYIILNALYLGVEEYVYFITNKLSTFGEILYYNKGAIKTLYNNNLNFNAGHIITSTYRVSYNGDRIVYFVDGFNKDRVINIDKVLLTDSIESLSISPIYSSSDYLRYDINSDGGNLRSGNYSVYISYNDINGKESNFKDFIENIPIGNGKYSDRTNITDTQYLNYLEGKDFDVYGLPENTPANKSIVIYPNVNTNYSSLNIYVILKLNTTTEVFLSENIPLDETIVISDLNSYSTLGNDISAVIVNNIVYNYSETLVQKDNRLLLANSKPEGHNIDFQSIANNITVTAVGNRTLFDGTQSNGITLLPENNTSGERSSHSTNNTRRDRRRISEANYLGYTQSIEVPSMSFMRDDVYALGVYFELDNGVITDVYHIPGRLPNNIPSQYLGGITEVPSLSPNWDTQEITLEGQTNQAWRLVNTAIKHPTEESSYLGYHRTNSVYPDGYGFPTNGEQNSQNKSYIRHHRIPSDFIFPLIIDTNLFAPSVNGYYKRERNFVNLKFDNINIPSNLQDKIKKIYFCIADRDEVNKKVIDKGIIYSLRTVGGGLRNSELLNNPVIRGVKNSSIFEYTSPNVDFKFKEFNIKADKIKINGTLSGSVDYMTKRYPLNITNSSAPLNGVNIVSFLNAEGINPSTAELGEFVYNYKQELTLTRVFYNQLIPKINTPYQVNISDNIFVDNNSVVSLGGVTVLMEGSQNTSLLQLNTNRTDTSSSLLPADNIYDSASADYKNRASTTASSSLFQQFYFDGSPVDPSISLTNRNAIRSNFFDSTQYVTLLSDNNELFTNLMQLTYTRITGNGEFYQGDCFIENHHTKKGYSTRVNNVGYQAAKSGYNVPSNAGGAGRRETIGTEGLVILYPSGSYSDPRIDFESNIDIAVSESYITYPVETRMNIRMRRQDGDNDHFPYNMFRTVYPVNQLEKKALMQEVYTLDSQFRDTKTVAPLGSNRIKLIDLESLNEKIGHRIIYSELQNNESQIDNFRRFLPNNYKDVVTNKGDIYKLFVKDNNLFIVTRDTLLRIGSSNNTLNSNSGNEIYVGTGAFLGTDPEDLISLETGFAGSRSKLSFNENQFGYCFVDITRNKIMIFNQTLTDVNELGLEEDITLELFKQFPELDIDQDKPLLGYGVLSGYDPETQRLFITKLDYKATDLLLNSNYEIVNGLFYLNNILLDFNNTDYFENKSFTITLDCLTNTWISYHDYFPNYYVPNPKIFTPKLTNISKYSNEFADKFIMDISMNENFNIVKVFDSLKFDVQSVDSDGYETEDFFDSIIVYNDKQSTGLINLNSVPFSNNLTKKENYWNYNYMLDNSIENSTKKLFTKDWSIIKDQYYIDKVLDPSQINFNKPWNQKHRIRDKYINIRLIKNNLDNKKFFINFVIANVRQSIR